METGNPMFHNRTDAGEQLARLLEQEGIEADLVVGIPRGGLPVAAPVADALDAPLDVVAAKKMGAPDNPELAVGAVASTGDVWYNDRLLSRLGVDDAYLKRERKRAASVAADKLRDYRGTSTLPTVTGRRIVLVDDGIATGATARACIQQLRSAGAGGIILAVPVAAASTARTLADEVDGLFAIETPESFGAVGQYYRQFEQVSDTQARAYLEDDQ